MNNEDLMRSFNQYIKHKKIGHLKINLFKKISLSFLIVFLFPLIFLNFFYWKSKQTNKLFIFPFNNKEPMKTIVDDLRKISNSQVILNPQALYIVPFILYRDVLICLIKRPIWTIQNLDFWGALALKISKYYGYKQRYGIKNMLIFQEYSFYSSYLTKIFESEHGKLYNMMHGIPGEEASFFRFSKCFVWDEYFKSYFIRNGAEEKQFVVSGSIFHQKLKEHMNNAIVIQYDIVYALQGDEYSSSKYKQEILKLLNELRDKHGLKIAIKPHPIYMDTFKSCGFDIITNSIYESIGLTQLVISQFSTMLYDAKSMGKKAFAFLPAKQLDLVSYLNKKEIATNYGEAYNKILRLLSEYSKENQQEENNLDTRKIIDAEIY